MEGEVGSDHLHGWKAISDYLGIKPDAARHLSRTQGLPTFKIGTKTVAASKARINAWLAERAANANASTQQTTSK
ncbi:DNA-binding protein [Methylorubrum extorquens]|uniref:DNA-binding protein n=1 Tax=Methylorubrum extorquens TaxID=408 RepID=UPI002237AB81|nr:DNA-binding protein [Methylorubrum extorquens]UYW25698.1 DNA-binding protein [Methylorubrum extorquens]